MPGRREPYPPIQPYRSDFLSAGLLHTLYVEQAGNPHGTPVVFLHGGPGAGTVPAHRRFFDPARARIILWDQRGAGRSTPHAETRDNSPELLVADLETIRDRLGIERWHLFGGSWGATLALLYAQAHPGRCLGLVLRGVFLLRRTEVEWFTRGARALFPEAWQAFAAAVSASERSDLLHAYKRRLDDADPAIHLPAARAWARWEDALCAPLCGHTVPSPGDDAGTLALARLEAHYMATHATDPGDARDVLRGIDRIRHIPCTIVQGRWDAVCPVASADALHRAWLEARYVLVPDAGHSAVEPGILAALLEAVAGTTTT